MRLCLDEHYAPAIAQELCRRGHDVTSIQGDAQLRGLTDEAVLEHCAGRRRVLLTENAADFVPLVQAWAARGDEHWGLVLSSPTSMPRGSDTVGLYIAALDRLLREHPAADALRNRVHWLRRPADGSPSA